MLINKGELYMKFNGKPIITADDFRYETVRIGDYVEQQVVNNAMDILPPACMKESCSQLGEPYSHKEDPETGEWKATYATFRKVGGEYPNGIWEYCGHCFKGENKERWTK